MKRKFILSLVNVMHVSVILLFNVHNTVSKFDRVTNRIGKREKENHLESQLKYL